VVARRIEDGSGKTLTKVLSTYKWRILENVIPHKPGSREDNFGNEKREKRE